MKKPSIDVRVTFLVFMAVALAGCTALFNRSQTSAGLKERRNAVTEIVMDDHS